MSSLRVCVRPYAAVVLGVLLLCAVGLAPRAATASEIPLAAPLPADIPTPLLWLSPDGVLPFPEHPGSHLDAWSSAPGASRHAALQVAAGVSANGTAAAVTWDTARAGVRFYGSPVSAFELCDGEASTSDAVCIPAALDFTVPFDLFVVLRVADVSACAASPRHGCLLFGSTVETERRVGDLSLYIDGSSHIHVRLTLAATTNETLTAHVESSAMGSPDINYDVMWLSIRWDGTDLRMTSKAWARQLQLQDNPSNHYSATQLLPHQNSLMSPVWIGGSDPALPESSVQFAPFNGEIMEILLFSALNRPLNSAHLNQWLQTRWEGLVGVDAPMPSSPSEFTDFDVVPRLSLSLITDDVVLLQSDNLCNTSSQSDALNLDEPISDSSLLTLRLRLCSSQSVFSSTNTVLPRVVGALKLSENNPTLSAKNILALNMMLPILGPAVLQFPSSECSMFSADTGTLPSSPGLFAPSLQCLFNSNGILDGTLMLDPLSGTLQSLSLPLGTRVEFAINLRLRSSEDTSLPDAQILTFTFTLIVTRPIFWTDAVANDVRVETVPISTDNEQYSANLSLVLLTDPFHPDQMEYLMRVQLHDSTEYASEIERSTAAADLRSELISGSAQLRVLMTINATLAFPWPGLPHEFTSTLPGGVTAMRLARHRVIDDGPATPLIPPDQSSNSAPRFSAFPFDRSASVEDVPPAEWLVMDIWNLTNFLQQRQAQKDHREVAGGPHFFEWHVLPLGLQVSEECPLGMNLTGAPDFLCETSFLLLFTNSTTTQQYIIRVQIDPQIMYSRPIALVSTTTELAPDTSDDKATSPNTNHDEADSDAESALLILLILVLICGVGYFLAATLRHRFQSWKDTRFMPVPVEGQISQNTTPRTRANFRAPPAGPDASGTSAAESVALQHVRDALNNSEDSAQEVELAHVHV